MINKVLPVIVGELNQFLKRKDGITTERAEIDSIVQASSGQSHHNQVICTLINLEQERVNLNMPMRGNFKKNPPIDLNLYALFSAVWPDDYLGALKDLSLTVGFFQGKQVFTHANTPGLPVGIEKITTEIFNMDLHQLSNLWSALGAKIVPSMVIKFRMVSISRDLILEEISEVTAIDSSTEARQKPS